MITRKSPVLMAVPQSPERRLEIIEAIRTLIAPDEGPIRRRRADIAVLRHDLEELSQNVADLWRQCEPQAQSYVIQYNPEQPRVTPNNRSCGGWTTSARAALLKASPDDTLHPGWPAGTPDGQGGKFRPKDGAGSDDGNRDTGNRQAPFSVAARGGGNQAECDEQRRQDEFICRLVRTPLCWAQAMERYAACIAGRPIPPLNF